MLQVIAAASMLVSPFLIKWVTNLVKKLQAIKFSGNKALILRGLVALFSFGSAIGTALITGTDITPETISSFVETLTTVGSETLLVFLGAQGVYFLGKNKEETQ